MWFYGNVLNLKCLLEEMLTGMMDIGGRWTKDGRSDRTGGGNWRS